MLESDEYIEPRFCYIQKRLLKLRQYLTTLIKGLRHHASLNVKHIPAYPGSKILHPAIDIVDFNRLQTSITIFCNPLNKQGIKLSDEDALAQILKKGSKLASHQLAIIKHNKSIRVLPKDKRQKLKEALKAFLTHCDTLKIKPDYCHITACLAQALKLDLGKLLNKQGCMRFFHQSDKRAMLACYLRQLLWHIDNHPFSLIHPHTLYAYHLQARKLAITEMPHQNFNQALNYQQSLKKLKRAGLTSAHTFSQLVPNDTQSVSVFDL